MTLFSNPDDIAIGRGLVEQRADPAGMLDRLRMGAYYRQQRELVARRGCCGRHEFEVHHGRLVCLHTREPCPEQRLQALVSLWVNVNTKGTKRMSTETAAATAAGTGQESALIPAATITSILALDKTVQDTRREIARAERDGNAMLKGFVLARGMQALRELLTPDIMKDVRALMNTPLGFRTDRDPARGEKPYDDDTVRDAVIAALMGGLPLAQVLASDPDAASQMFGTAPLRDDDEPRHVF